MLDEEQIKNIKEQIIKQIDSWHSSKEQKEQAKNQIQRMSAKELEDFLIKNKLIKTEQKAKEEQSIQQCPFCLILEGKIQAYKIDENKKTLAVLEINPISKGHVLVIPKQHKETNKIPTQSFSLAKKIATKLKSKLKPKPQDISIQTANLVGHGIISLIPIYKNKKLERKQASEKELKKLQEKLKGKKGKEIKRKPKKLEKAPKRIP
jgi:histidine triad (HIT) family protein